jgi:hypothetical protein
LSSPLNRGEALHCSFVEQWSHRRKMRRRRGEADLGVVMLLLTVAHEAGVWSSGGARERRLQGKILLLPLPCASRGRRRSIILLKQHCSALFLCEHCMKRRPFAQNTLFHLKGNGVKNMSNS